MEKRIACGVRVVQGMGKSSRQTQIQNRRVGKNSAGEEKSGSQCQERVKQGLPAIVMKDIHDHQIVAHREYEVTVVLGMSEIG